MGKQPPEDIIDAEIVPLIRLLNSAPYIETTSSCSGFSNTVPTRIVDSMVVQGHFRSDGQRRKWTGHPYVTFRAIGNRDERSKCLDFVDHLISKLIFHNEDEKTEQYPAKFDFHGRTIKEMAIRNTPRYAEFKRLAQSVGMSKEEHGRLFPLFTVGYHDGFTIKVMVRACIDTLEGQDIYEERTPGEVMRIWKLIECVAKDFIQENK